MTAAKVATHLAVWSAVLVAWLLVTRPYHPTPLIWVLATAILVAASASAVYVHRHYVLNGFGRHRSRGRYTASLVVLVAVLDLAAVLLIQLVYDVLWGPDPNRFGFWFNFGSDGFIIVLHLIGAACVGWVVSRIRGGTAQER